MNKKILLAGPGTGKTYKIKKDFLSKIGNFNNVLVLSFTNATINDLLKSFEEDSIPINRKNCMTLHGYALKLNHKSDFYILNDYEIKVLEKYSKKLNIDFDVFCEMLNCITYDQMISKIIEFYKTNKVYFGNKIGNIDLLIVDEFQDFNEKEQELIDIISNYSKELIILGDDDQTLYGQLKGARSDKLIEMYNGDVFENIEHKNICRRCPDCVVEKAKNLILNNKNRVDKEWQIFGKEGIIKYVQKLTQNESAKKIIETIKWIKKYDPGTSIMVLSPIEYATRELKDKLEKENLEFLDFFNKNFDLELYKLIWRLNLIYGKYKLLNLFLVINSGDISSYKKQKFIRIISEFIKEGLVFDNLFNEVKEFLDDELIDYIENKPDFKELLSLEEWGLIKENIDCTDVDNIDRFLQLVNNLKNNQRKFNKDSVNIMSIFKSKGLQADHVFILGLVDGILPRTSLSTDRMEEQRRMFFVGMTRSQKNLYLLSTIQWPSDLVHKLGKERFTFDFRSKNRLYNGQASPFIKELKL